MIELILIAGASLLVAVFCVWIYRRVSEMQGENTSLVSLSGNKDSLNVSQQQGYARISVPRKNAIGLAVGIGTSRKPWGW